MKYFFLAIFFILFSVVFGVLFVLDQWLGIGAYIIQFSLVCIISALAFALWWHVAVQRPSKWVGIVAFVILIGILFLPPPSERILRSVMLKVSDGDSATSIKTIVELEYKNSPFRLPAIKMDEGRVSVSLLSQKAGNCTAIIFKIVDGKVADREFLAD